MSYVLFVDESGGQDSCYDVLAGVSIEDRDLWNMVLALQDAEIHNFGRPYRSGNREIKAKKILKRKTFKQAKFDYHFTLEEQVALAKKALDSGETANARELTALARAKLNYTRDVLEICARYRCKIFASIVHTTSPKPTE
jgi:hypothetical protein